MALINGGTTDLVTNHYVEAGFDNEPNNIWDDKKMRTIIQKEKELLDQKTGDTIVSIYKIEDRTSHQCYIGQTIRPDLRRKQHFSNSSNRGLREAIQQKGKGYFDFDVIECVKGGAKAYVREEHWINYYRNRSVVNLVQGMEQVAGKSSEALVVIYKIKSLTNSTAYIGYTTNPESVRKIIKSDGAKRFIFEIIRTEVPWAKASTHIANEIKKHKDWAVFNRQDPEKARYSNQLRIEMFCQHFQVPYDEVLESPEKFENMKDKFDNVKKEVIEREKQRTVTGVFKPNEIADPILRAFATRYEDRKEEAGALDFLDMLIRSANMLEKHSDLRRKYQEKYRYIFVDEFQDISPVDFRLINLFSKNLFAVGDDDQAIYGFRGGDSLIMQEKFGKQKNVTHYEITRNYRSTSTIVRHAKALIEHNSLRVPKNLRAQKSAKSRIEFLETSRDTVEGKSLEELLPIVTACETHFKGNTPDLDNPLLQELTDPQQIGILARNWYEVNPIQTHLNSILKNKGFQIRWSDSDDKEKRKLVMRRSEKKIEISTIHSAKGQEWDKVIFLVNNKMKTGPDRKPIPSIPDPRNVVEDERRLFYVAVTRAKQELVILDGGSCEFVPEFQNVPSIETSETEQPEKSIIESVSSDNSYIPGLKKKTTDKISVPPPTKRSTARVVITTPVTQIQQTTATIVPPRSVPADAVSRHNVDENTGTINRNIWTPDQLDQIVETYLDRLIFAFENKYQLTNINQGFIKQEMIRYLTELDSEGVNKIASLITLDGATAMRIGRYADYVIGKEKIHLCTDIFRGFWRRMWAVVEQSRNMRNPQR